MFKLRFLTGYIGLWKLLENIKNHQSNFFNLGSYLDYKGLVGALRGWITINHNHILYDSVRALNRLSVTFAAHYKLTCAAPLWVPTSKTSLFDPKIPRAPLIRSVCSDPKTTLYDKNKQVTFENKRYLYFMW